MNTEKTIAQKQLRLVSLTEEDKMSNTTSALSSINTQIQAKSKGEFSHIGSLTWQTTVSLELARSFRLGLEGNTWKEITASSTLAHVQSQRYPLLCFTPPRPRRKWRKDEGRGRLYAGSGSEIVNKPRKGERRCLHFVGIFGSCDVLEMGSVLGLCSMASWVRWFWQTSGW